MFCIQRYSLFHARFCAFVLCSRRPLGLFSYVSSRVTRSHYGLIILWSLLSILSVLSALIAASCFVLLPFRVSLPLIPRVACVSSRFCVVGFVLSTLRSPFYALHRFVLRALYPLSVLCSRLDSDSPLLDGSSDKRFCRQWVELQLQ